MGDSEWAGVLVNWGKTGKIGRRGACVPRCWCAQLVVLDFRNPAAFFVTFLFSVLLIPDGWKGTKLSSWYVLENLGGYGGGPGSFLLLKELVGGIGSGGLCPGVWTMYVLNRYSLAM